MSRIGSITGRIRCYVASLPGSAPVSRFTNGGTVVISLNAARGFGRFATTMLAMAGTAGSFALSSGNDGSRRSAGNAALHAVPHAAPQEFEQSLRGDECIADYVHGISGTGLAATVGTPSLTAVKVWDDGTGPALYVGGRFSSINGVPAVNVAKFDGTTWSALATVGVPTTAQRVTKLEVFNDGGQEYLFIGGTFASVDGDPDMKALVRWDGTSISLAAPVGSTVTSFGVTAMTVGDLGGGPQLFVSGNAQIHRKSGGVWVNTNPNFNNGTTVHTMCVFVKDDVPYLYVGGNMVTNNGQSSPGMARWDGTTWSWTGNFNQFGVVRSLHVYNDGNGPALYAGGNFTSIGNVGASRIARLPRDGFATANWQSLGSGLAEINGCPGCPTINDMTTFDDGTGPALYVVGAFESISGTFSPAIARFRDGQWHSVGSGHPMNGTVNAGVLSLAKHETCGPLTPDGQPALFFGGNMTTVAGQGNLSIGMYQGCPVEEGEFSVADLNRDGAVNSSDLFILLAAWGPCDTYCACLADLNGDGQIDSLDLIMLLALWG